MNLLADLNVAAPDVLLAGFGLGGVLLGAVLGDGAARPLRYLGALALAVAAWLALKQVSEPSALAFTGLYAVTPFTAFAKAVGFALGALALWMSGGWLRRTEIDRYEYALLMVFGSLGAGVMLSANNLMTLYMGIETLSLSSYVMAAFQRDNMRSSEAGLKYFVLGALASGLLLYGSSLIYGFSHSADFAAIAAAPTSIGLVFGLVLLITGLAFKASAAPFHVWTPDVYEGAPAPVVAFFATAPKIGAVVVIANVMFGAFGPHIESWRYIIAIIAAASMLIGAFGALRQTNVKRILAYSSIGNVGFALIGVAAGKELGAASVLIYTTLYVVSTLGLFAGVIAMRRNGKPIEDVSDLNGLIRQKPAVALGLIVLIFSVAGIPPGAGFWGKVQVFEAGLRADMLWLVLVGAAASVVSLGYYLRLVWAIAVKPVEGEMDRTDGPVAFGVLATAAMAFPVLFIGIQSLVAAANAATGR